MTDVKGSNGYKNFAVPANDDSVRGCLKQASNIKDFELNIKGGINDDPIAINLDVIQSQGPGYYTMDNMYGCGCELKDARNVQLSQPMVNFNGGKGWIGEKGCLVDKDSELRENKERLTNKRYIHQLVERPHLTTRNLIKGYYDVDIESIIRPGIRTVDKKTCNNLSGIFIGNQYEPLIPKVLEEVQDTKHIIPEDSMNVWVRGGLPTRQMVKNKDYLKRCQQKQYLKTDKNVLVN